MVAGQVFITNGQRVSPRVFTFHRQRKSSARREQLDKHEYSCNEIRILMITSVNDYVDVRDPVLRLCRLNFLRI